MCVRASSYSACAGPPAGQRCDTVDSLTYPIAPVLTLKTTRFSHATWNVGASVRALAAPCSLGPLHVRWHANTCCRPTRFISGLLHGAASLCNIFELHTMILGYRFLQRKCRHMVEFTSSTVVPSSTPNVCGAFRYKRDCCLSARKGNAAKTLSLLATKSEVG